MKKKQFSELPKRFASNFPCFLNKKWVKIPVLIRSAQGSKSWLIEYIDDRSGQPNGVTKIVSSQMLRMCKPSESHPLISNCNHHSTVPDVGIIQQQADERGTVTSIAQQAGERSTVHTNIEQTGLDVHILSGDDAIECLSCPNDVDQLTNLQSVQQVKERVGEMSLIDTISSDEEGIEASIHPSIEDDNIINANDSNSMDSIDSVDVEVHEDNDPDLDVDEDVGIYRPMEFEDEGVNYSAMGRL